MKKAKRTLLVITVMTALVLMGGWALARGPSGKRGDRYAGSGYGCNLNLSPEQEERLQAEREKFHKDTAELRRELYLKRLELKGLWIDPKTDPEKIKSKQREMFELKRQFQEKRLEHRLAVRELLPQEHFDQLLLGPGLGMGYGPRHGKGRKWEPGFGARGGYGRGPCW